MGLPPPSPPFPTPHWSPAFPQVISGQQLPKVNKNKNSIVDPKVTVEIHGVGRDTASRQTAVVTNNGTCGAWAGPPAGAGVHAADAVLAPLGFNPWWDTEFEFEVVVPELALVRFLVEDYDASSKNDFIGQSTIPLGSLKQGECVLRGGDREVGEAGPAVSCARPLSLEASSSSDRNSPCVLSCPSTCQDTATSTSCPRTETSTLLPPSL